MTLASILSAPSSVQPCCLKNWRARWLPPSIAVCRWGPCTIQLEPDQTQTAAVEACIIIQRLTRSWSSVHVSSVVDLHWVSGRVRLLVPIRRSTSPRCCSQAERIQSPHEAEVHAERSMHSRTRQADEDAIWHRCPRRVLRWAIEADLHRISPCVFKHRHPQLGAISSSRGSCGCTRAA